MYIRRTQSSAAEVTHCCAGHDLVLQRDGATRAHIAALAGQLGANSRKACVGGSPCLHSPQEVSALYSTSIMTSTGFHAHAQHLLAHVTLYAAHCTQVGSIWCRWCDMDLAGFFGPGGADKLRDGWYPLLDPSNSAKEVCTKACRRPSPLAFCFRPLPLLFSLPLFCLTPLPPPPSITPTFLPAF